MERFLMDNDTIVQVQAQFDASQELVASLNQQLTVARDTLDNLERPGTAILAEAAWQDVCPQLTRMAYFFQRFVIACNTPGVRHFLSTPGARKASLEVL